MSVLSQKIFEKVTEDVKVTAGDVLAYYRRTRRSTGRPSRATSATS